MGNVLHPRLFFKLYKDGAHVGYMDICGHGAPYSDDVGIALHDKNKRRVSSNHHPIEFDIAKMFVCFDCNGDSVFDGDTVKEIGHGELVGKVTLHDCMVWEVVGDMGAFALSAYGPNENGQFAIELV
jgi:hypothetical protein